MSEAGSAIVRIMKMLTEIEINKFQPGSDISGLLFLY
jgi:hypothetical protein